MKKKNSNLLVLFFLVTSSLQVIANDSCNEKILVIENPDIKYIQFDYNKFLSEKELGVSQDAPEVIKAYFRKMFKEIGKTAKIPDKSLNGKMSVAFTVNNDGTVSGVRISESSGDIDVDQAALKSVIYAAPFSQFPAGLNYSSFDVTYAFSLGNYANKNLSKALKPVLIKTSSLNPMKYKFNKSYGHYLESSLIQITEQNLEISKHHFKTMPIKYYIISFADSDKDLITECIGDFSKYFEFKEVNSKETADILIDIDNKLDNKLGYAKTKYDSDGFKASVFLNSKLFTYPYSIQAKYIIKHELLHSLGILGHSDDPNDVLFTGLNISCDYGSYECLIKETGVNKTEKTFGELTERDLNTLWLLYNQWE